MNELVDVHDFGVYAGSKIKHESASPRLPDRVADKLKLQLGSPVETSGFIERFSGATWC